jgi:hypothetical protein
MSRNKCFRLSWFFSFVIGTFAGTQAVLANVAPTGSASLCQSNVSANDPELEAAVASLFIDELGYTLIGAKPVSIQESTTCYLGQHPEVAKKFFSFLTRAFKNSPGFILKISRECGGCHDIELFNKAALRKVIAEHRELLVFIKKKFIDIDGFFSHVQHSKESVFATFNYNDFLLGLILGYGRDNSEYYCRINDAEFDLKRNALFSMFLDDLKPKSYGFRSLSFFFLESSKENYKCQKTKEKFDSLEAEWEWLQRVRWDLTDSCKAKPPYYIHLPFYICRHGGDSEQVRSKYIKARDRLANLFYNRSFTKIVAEMAAKKGKDTVTGLHST